MDYRLGRPETGARAATARAISGSRSVRNLSFLAGIAFVATVGSVAPSSTAEMPDVEALPLVIEPGMPPLAEKLLRQLHSRYVECLRNEGRDQLRTRIRSEIEAARDSNGNGTSTILNWIDIAGWGVAADLLFDLAESNDDNLRVSASALLSGRPSDLVKPADYEERTRRLMERETVPLALGYWQDLHSRLLAEARNP